MAEVGLRKGDVVNEQSLARFAKDAEEWEGPDWRWVNCGEPNCNVCEGLRAEFPDRENRG